MIQGGRKKLMNGKREGKVKGKRRKGVSEGLRKEEGRSKKENR